MNLIPLTIPGVSIAMENQIEPIGNIIFTVPRSKTPLVPLVDAMYVKEAIQICIVVFIDATLSPNFTVYQHNAISDDGSAIVQFFIQYDGKESQQINFNAYQLSFQLNAMHLPKDFPLFGIDQIQAFLWDSDPVASRGTITNVQRN
ncbi:hypothetical protein AAEO56_02455 [Flavobacterium sp. DGU11]|uniref:Uncharacterized protein n=1 Tax=Flavobacterium arundinis TaxID=3139143 RepID=A0ABU9HSH3_9FLAO